MQIKHQMPNGESCFSHAVVALAPALLELQQKCDHLQFYSDQAKHELMYCLELRLQSNVFTLQDDVTKEATKVVFIEDFATVYGGLLLMHYKTELQQLTNLFELFDEDGSKFVSCIDT
jgi:hypothetical protein